MRKVLLLIVSFFMTFIYATSQEDLNSKTPSFNEIIKEYEIQLRDTFSYKNEIFINGNLKTFNDSIDIFTNATVIVLGFSSYEVSQEAAVRVNKINNKIDFVCMHTDFVNVKAHINNNYGYYNKCDFDSQVIVTEILEDSKSYSKYLKKIEENKDVDL